LLGFVRRLVGSRHGATAVEYTTLVALIAVAVIAALDITGLNIRNVLGTAGNAMT
jgi:Flp pilus assembly pilin Flp